MPTERPALTKEQVAQAESRIGITHPVLTVIENHLPTLIQLSNDYPKTSDNQGQSQYIREHYGFLADAFVEAGPYTLEPLDLIAIWSRVTRGVFPLYARYRLAGMVSSIYAIQGVENPEWRKFPRHYLETGELPECVTRDRGGLLYVQSRLRQIGESLEDIDFYIYGTREPAMSYAFQLAKREAEGDEEAKKKLEALILHEKTHTTPILSELLENFGNGYVSLYWPIEKTLGVLIETT
ncbi:MAG: hypothetical protein PHE48_03195 [Candidatus Daviesbacteria bacterium]|nr:hypothetical protein [Candidatus Daviesbacteria bacterium]